VKQVAALSRAEDLVKNREKMKVDILERARPEVGDLLEIVDVSLTNIDLSDQLEQAIEQKVVREQEALAKTFELDKEKKQAEITIVRAEAEAKSVSIKGEAIKASPEVIQLEIAQRWDGKAPLSVSVGQNGAGANVLLPLGK
jgi:regulator of protease activity HflC (stomatin/prohibitin superfamily)